MSVSLTLAGLKVSHGPTRAEDNTHMQSVYTFSSCNHHGILSAAFHVQNKQLFAADLPVLLLPP